MQNQSMRELFYKILLGVDKIFISNNWGLFYRELRKRRSKIGQFKKQKKIQFSRTEIVCLQAVISPERILVVVLVFD